MLCRCCFAVAAFVIWSNTALVALTKLTPLTSATTSSSFHSFPGELEELQSVLHFPEEVALRITDAEYQLFYQVRWLTRTCVSMNFPTPLTRHECAHILSVCYGWYGDFRDKHNVISGYQMVRMLARLWTFKSHWVVANNFWFFKAIAQFNGIMYYIFC